MKIQEYINFDSWITNLKLHGKTLVISDDRNSVHFYHLEDDFKKYDFKYECGDAKGRNV